MKKQTLTTRLAYASLLALFLISYATTGETIKPETAPGDISKPAVWAVENNGRVLVGWRPETWDKAQTGYVVLRKAEPEKGFTQPVNALVKPGITLQNAQRLGLDKAAHRISVGTVNELPEKVLQTIYSQYGVKEYVALRENDLQMLQLSGFGWVDDSVQPGVRYTYKVVPVINGQQGDALGTVSITAGTGRPEVSVHNFSATRKSGSLVELIWSVDKTEAASKGLSGFKIYAANVEDAVEEIDPVMVLPARTQTSADTLLFAYHDMKNNKGKPVKYAVRPMFRGNRFGQLSRRVVAPAAGQKLPDPVLKSSDFSKDNTVTISWTFPAQQQFTGFTIYRIAEQNAQKVKLNDKPLPSGARSFVDKTPPAQPGSVFRYQVEAVSGDYRLSPVSHEVLPLRIPYPVPSAPQNLVATRVENEGKAAYRLSWDTPEIPGIEYRVKQLVSGKWLNALPAMKQNSAVLQVGNFPAGESLTFAITAVNKDGVEGEQSLPAELTAYSNKGLKAVSALKATALPAAARISWKFFAPDSFKGFRLYVDGKRTMDESRLQPLVRRVFLPGLKPQTKHTIKIVAVSQDGTEGEKATTIVEAKTVAVHAVMDTVSQEELLKNPQVKHEVIYFGSTPQSGTAVEFDYITDSKGRKWFHGTKKAYNPDGSVFSEHQYYAGKMNGIQKWYGPEGELLRKLTYRNGELVHK